MAWLSAWMAASRRPLWNSASPSTSQSRAFTWVAGALVLFVIAAAAFRTIPTMMYSERDGHNLEITIELNADATLATAQQCADVIGEILWA